MFEHFKYGHIHKHTNAKVSTCSGMYRHPPVYHANPSHAK